MSSLSIGIDIGGTSIKAGLVRENQILGDIIDVPTPNSLELFRSKLTDIIDQFRGDRPGEEIKIGLGIPGLVSSRDHKIAFCPNLQFLNDLPFDSLLQNYCPSIANDADMALYGEMVLGNLWGEDVLLLTLGTGLGSAFYAGGKGSWELNLAGEAGHMKIVPNGKQCSCGERGCLEAYFSANALISESRARILGKITDVEDIFEYLKSGEPNARVIIDNASKVLGLGIANLVNILGVSRVILGGKISQSYEWFSGPVYDAAKQNIHVFSERKFTIEQSKYVDKAAIIGAADYAYIV